MWPPAVESSAPLLVDPIVPDKLAVCLSIFCENFGGFAADPTFLDLKGYSSKCSSLKLDPILIISISLPS